MEPENFLSLFVGVRVDSATFRSDGYVLLELVPTDQTGQTFVSEPWEILATLEEPTQVLVSTDTQWVQSEDPRPVGAAILIDDSGSMFNTDPNLERAAAARLFARQFLAPNPQNRVALADFGWPTDSSTIGFARTRILQEFTSDLDQIDAGASKIEPIKGGGTHLYRSALEVADWTDATLPSTYRRMLVVVTDGAPTNSDLPYRDQLFAEAVAQDMRILAVGVGPASDQSGESVDSAVAVVRELATATGGVYFGATNSTQLVPVLSALANVSSQRQLLVLLRLNPPPPPGTNLSGTVTITGQRGSASARWTTITP
jgi:Mg-chelatase subunit ChlD